MAHRDPDTPRPSALSIEDGKGDEVLPEGQKTEEQVVIATDSQGNSLTLLEEYAARKKDSISPLELAISITCATASLAFATLIYFNTH
ncbi:hypothetical protein [Pelagicoccus mobilis]|uniref:Uncharacterized protein n=1 Tax=Pelagicoccus mobilis TaxID=415221 RepID=A0A934VLS1_9BACT|nr:hypothetical protein [Pelagicoccus mobilis]MBK1878061.1 hypothetical protein [Pelagicoccus mobilis]